LSADKVFPNGTRARADRSQITDGEFLTLIGPPAAAKQLLKLIANLSSRRTDGFSGGPRLRQGRDGGPLLAVFQDRR
jgi:hypothetical protein